MKKTIINNIKSIILSVFGLIVMGTSIYTELKASSIVEDISTNLITSKYSNAIFELLGLFGVTFVALMILFAGVILFAVNFSDDKISFDD